MFCDPVLSATLGQEPEIQLALVYGPPSRKSPRVSQ
jgi:hypothetical protein